MRGDAEIIELLNDVLTAELTAINQYFVHAKMCENWGYERLASTIRDESIDEMKHAEQLDRAHPLPRGRPQPAAARQAARRRDRRPSSSSIDLALEIEARRAAQPTASRLAVDKGDNGTRELLEDILVDEEEHVDWLETQLETIRQIGIENYLAQQLHD